MATPPAGIQATPAVVATILRARTQDSNGHELGAFTDDTRPTLDQVQETLALAQVIVASMVGDPVAACAERFAVAVCFEAACIIEKSYFPEQIQSGRSQYDQLRAETDTLISGVRDCQQGNLPDGDASEQSWRAYDVCTPPGPCSTTWPYDWWQRNLDQAP